MPDVTCAAKAEVLAAEKVHDQAPPSPAVHSSSTVVVPAPAPGRELTITTVLAAVNEVQRKCRLHPL